MRNISLVVLVISICTVAANAAIQFPGANGTWEGYDRYEMTISERATQVYAPAQAAEGNPWVMRALWFGYNKEIDTGLLARGYHVVYMDLGVYQYGSPQAVAMWDGMYEEMTTTYNLADEAVLVGGSRGGLQIHNWALQNIDKVQGIFGNVPVCDFKSWPGNWPESNYWKMLKLIYGFATNEEVIADITAGDAEAFAYQGNIVDAYAPLIGSGIPIMHIAGTADESVSLGENSQLLYDRLTAAGGQMRLEVMQGGIHADTWDRYMTSVNGDLTETLDYITGVQTPEPLTLSLLGIGGMSLIMRRNSR